MALKQQLRDDLKAAMKAGDPEKVATVRLLQSVIQNKEIEKRGKSEDTALSDDEVIAAFMTEAKKRKEAIETFEKGGRNDLADKEKKELSIIASYLPAQMSREEAERAVSEILAKNPADNFGAAMKAVMEELRGKVDAKMVTEIVKSKLG